MCRHWRTLKPLLILMLKWASARGYDVFSAIHSTTFFFVRPFFSIENFDNFSYLNFLLLVHLIWFDDDEIYRIYSLLWLTIRNWCSPANGNFVLNLLSIVCTYGDSRPTDRQTDWTTRKNDNTVTVRYWDRSNYKNRPIEFLLIRS